MVEHNEAKLKDLTIPIFDLEQRVEKLENNFTNYQVDVIGKLAD